MSISAPNNTLVTINNFCDYIPVVSTVSNIVDLFQKVVIFPFLDKKTIESSHYFTHLNNKSALRCLVLLVPLVGNIVVIFWDVGGLKNRAESKAIQKKVVPISDGSTV